MFLIGNGGGLNTLFDDTSFATMAAEKAILCVIFEEFSWPDEISINTYLILKNMFDNMTSNIFDCCVYQAAEDKVRFLDALFSQAGLFGDIIEDCVLQFSAVQKQTEAFQHILPRRDAHLPPLRHLASPSLLVAVGAFLSLPELLHPVLNRHLGRRVEPLAGARRPPDLSLFVHRRWKTLHSGQSPLHEASSCLGVESVHNLVFFSLRRTRRWTIGVVLSSLQERLERRFSPSTLKAYVVVITAHHVAVAGRSLGKHDLIARFLRGARRLNPPRPPLVPCWDLFIVLAGLQRGPFEPPDTGVELKFLFAKTVL